MIRLRVSTWKRIIVVLTALVSTLFVVSACGTTPKTSSSPKNVQQTYRGNVVIFTPSDGLALTRHKPLSTWDHLVPEIVKDLKNKGFSDDSITTKTSSSLSQQSQDVQDYVVNLLTPLHLENHNNKNKQNTGNSSEKIKKKLSKTTIVIAPWTNKNGNNNYGDYATLPAANKTENTKSKHGLLTSKNDSEDTDKNILLSQKRLASSLRLAQKSGVHVVMLSRSIPGFKPDVLFHLSDASSIGETQAATLVQKLALDRATRENPRYIEVLLPCHNQKNINLHAKTTSGTNGQNSNESNNSNASDSNNADSNSENQNSSSNNNQESQNSDENSSDNADTDSSTQLEDEFAKEAFAGMWKVLRPYFASGTLLSTSGKLHANSSEKDWTNVAFDADDSDAVKTELKNRITKHNNLLTPSLMHVDGIIALDDQVALQASQTLSDLGYEGSAADINPSFTLPDVIGNFIGKRNLIKRPVPSPKNSSNKHAKDAQISKEQSDDANDAAHAKKWPAITGYGAYKNIMPNIVSGKQWMTTIEHQAQISKDITEMCDSLNRTGNLSKKIATKQSTIEPGITVPTVYEQLLAVSATNLKARLIDPGYISLADAGL